MKYRLIMFKPFIVLCLIFNVVSYAQSNDEMIQIKGQKWGYAVLKEKVSFDKIDLANSQLVINQNNDEVFIKRMDTYGMSFWAMEKVSDVFILKVGQCYQEMFAQKSSLDIDLQHQIINTLYHYAATIPVLSVHHDKISKKTEEALFALEVGNYSVCDVIMIDSKQQTMEVVEHLIHHISDVGLFYVFPEEWGFNNKESTVVKSMQNAIEKGYFQIKDYEDLKEMDDELYQRILVQEYAYWIITTYWNIQEKYGPNEKEWRIRNKKELLEKLPIAYELIETTVNKIMIAPSDDILSSF